MIGLCTLNYVVLTIQICKIMFDSKSDRIAPEKIRTTFFTNRQNPFVVCGQVPSIFVVYLKHENRTGTHFKSEPWVFPRNTLDLEKNMEFKVENSWKQLKTIWVPSALGNFCKKCHGNRNARDWKKYRPIGEMTSLPKGNHSKCWRYRTPKEGSHQWALEYVLQNRTKYWGSWDCCADHSDGYSKPMAPAILHS